MRRSAYLVIGFAMDLMLGTAYSWSVVTRPLRDGFGASDFEAMLPSAVALAGFAIGMVPGGRLLDRHGPRRVAMLGGALFGAGYLLSSLMAVTPWPLVWLTVTYGVVLGLGIGVTYSATLATAVRWYPERKGLASGIVVMGFGLSALLTAPLLGAMIAAYGIPTSFMILGVVFLAGLELLALFLVFPPETPRAAVPAAGAKRAWQPLAEVETRAMLHTRTFWLAWLLYAVGTSAGFMVINKALPIAEEVGQASGALAVAAVQLLAVFNCIGRPLFGRASDRWGPREATELMGVVLLGGLAMVIAAPNIVVLYLGIGLIGSVFGGFLAVMPSLSSYFFGTSKLGLNYGLLFTGYGLGSMVALFTIGPIHDAFGTYLPAFWLALGLAAAALFLSFLLRPPRPAPAFTPQRAGAAHP
jgi:OFA family oxalate/formate antiporter-like MFS transporter